MEMSDLIKNKSNSPADLSAVYISFSRVFSSCPLEVSTRKGSDFKKWEPAAEKRVFFRPSTILEPYSGERFARSTRRPPVFRDRFLRRNHRGQRTDTT